MMKHIAREVLMIGLFVLVGGASLGIAVAVDSGNDVDEMSIEVIKNPAEGAKAISYIPQGLEAGSEFFPPNARQVGVMRGYSFLPGLPPRQYR